jgi:hypothetical protein
MTDAIRSRAMLLVVSLVSAWAIIAIGPAGAQPPGGKGGYMPRLKMVKKFDRDGAGRLDSAERHAAMEYLNTKPQLRQKGRSPVGEPREPSPGPKIAPDGVKTYPASVPLFDAGTLRTLFLDFADADWEKQLVAFHRTDVLVPTKLTVDGKVYRDVGVRFRGENSFFMVRDGWKRSFTLDLDFVHTSQNLCGYHGLHLLNFHEDPTFLRTILYMEIARHYFAAPKANFLRVVINGESWGVYANQQKFDKDFLRDNFHTTKGARLRSPGRSRNGNFVYLGDDVAAYKRFYALHSKDNPKAWSDLVRLCKLLDQTPPEQLRKALEPLLDLDSTLAWLALDNVVVNDDSYWHDGNDFAIYQDVKGRFHLVPHDVNEAFRPVRVRSGGDGLRIDPFANMTNKNRPLLKLLAVPELRTRYLRYVKDIAENWLNWKKLGPIVEKYRELIAADVKTDTRKLHSTAEFTSDTFGKGDGTAVDGRTLKGFCEQRRTHLLNLPEIKKLDQK